MTARGVGRKLQPRSDTERLDLLVKLLGFGQSRAVVTIDWGSLGKALELASGPVGDCLKTHVADENGDLRALLDRAISKNVGVKPQKRPRRKS